MVDCGRPLANLRRASQNLSLSDLASDGAFNEFIQLPAEKPGRQIVVFRAVGINGGILEQKRPVMVGE